MSDGFDKEAEREKLREKFAEDEEKREHTQRMSELLLQGATMTNRHCETCGDPIFRHDGREFCPTCHATEDGYEVPAADETGAEEGGATADAGSTASSGTTPNRPESATAGGDATAASDAAPNATEPAGIGSERDASEGVVGRSPPSTTTAASSNSTDEATSGRDATAHDATGGVAAARESLTRTLTRFARAAEETDDPRRARDHLRAAREAAEALAALD